MTATGGGADDAATCAADQTDGPAGGAELAAVAVTAGEPPPQADAVLLAEPYDPQVQAQARLKLLDATLSATLDAGLRLRRVAQFIRETEPAVLACVFESAARGSIDGGWRQAWVALTHWILHARPRPRFPVGHWPVPDDELAPGGTHIAETIEAAVVLELPWSRLVLRDAFARIAPNEGRLLQLHPSVDKWSLGWRRERARMAETSYQAFLLLDSTPAVVQIIAENPKTLEPHAVQMASMRPQHPWALQALLLQPRWLGNDRVCEAVARNNSTPGWLVLLLAPLLPRKVQMALVHLAWIDRDVRAILGRWHGVEMVRVAQMAPGDAVHVAELPDMDADLAALMQKIADEI